jgi:putative ATPase
VPLHLRNAPTRLMKDLGYGEGYKYAHDEAEGVSEMSCLPERLQGRRYYEPTDRGIEARIREALERARRLRQGQSDE